MRNSTLQSEPYRYNRYKGTGSTCGWEILPIMAYKGGGAPPKRGTCIFFRLQVSQRVGISPAEVYKRVVKSVIWVCERAQRANR